MFNPKWTLIAFIFVLISVQEISAQTINNTPTAQTKYTSGNTNLQIDTSRIINRCINEIEIKYLRKQQVFDSGIIEMNKQIASMTQTVASTKESFYNSRISLWSFILGAIGLIIVVAGYFGVKSISDRLTETKDDLTTRISEFKDDFREFKTDEQRKFEKFENDSKKIIDKGLDSAIQEAISKIFKGSYSKEIDDLREQVAEMQQKLDELYSKMLTDRNERIKEDVNEFDSEYNKVTKIKINAFDD